jgi:hypothetical protein
MDQETLFKPKKTFHPEPIPVNSLDELFNNFRLKSND